MKHFSIFLLLFFLISKVGLAENDATKLKTTGQELSEQKVTSEELCKIACESEYSKCYNNIKENATPCLAKISSCKEGCNKEAGNK